MYTPTLPARLTSQGCFLFLFLRDCFGFSWEYKPPQSLDIPIKWATTLLKDVKNPTGFHGSKAVGEPPLLMATSVFMAIKEAVKASRKDAYQEGWVQL